MIYITLNQIKERQPCKDGWRRLLKGRGLSLFYEGDDEPFPMHEILDTNVLEDCIWAMRCVPERADLWRKFAIWCGKRDTDLVIATTQQAAGMAFWCSKFASSRFFDGLEAIKERERQAAKLKQILIAGEWIND